MKALTLRNSMLSLFILQGSNYLLPLLTLPYLTRTLGTENFGHITFVQAVIYYFIALTDYGFNLTATRSASLVKNQPEKLHRLFSIVTSIKIGIMLIGLALILSFFSIANLPKTEKYLYLFAYLSVIGSTLFPIWFFQGTGHTGIMSLISITSRSIMIILIFLLVKEQEDYLLALALQSGGTLLAGIVSCLVLYKKKLIQPCLPTTIEIQYEIRNGWHVFISSIAVNLYTSTTTVILGILAGSTSVAYFSAAEKIIKAIHGIFIPVSQACYPHIARLAQKSQYQALRFIGNLLMIQGGITLCIAFLIFNINEKLVISILGQGFIGSSAILQWMAFLPFIVSLSNILGTQTMLNFGMKILFSRILLFSGILHIILSIPLIYFFKEYGAAISILSTETIVTLLMGFSLHQKKLIQIIFQREKSSYE